MTSDCLVTSCFHRAFFLLFPSWYTSSSAPRISQLSCCGKSLSQPEELTGDATASTGGSGFLFESLNVLTPKLLQTHQTCSSQGAPGEGECGGVGAPGTQNWVLSGKTGVLVFDTLLLGSRFRVKAHSVHEPCWSQPELPSRNVPARRCCSISTFGRFLMGIRVSGQSV